MMKELKVEIETRERVRESKGVNVNRTSHKAIEGLVKTDKIFCPFCQQDYFQDSCNVVTNANTITSIHMLCMYKESSSH